MFSATINTKSRIFVHTPTNTTMEFGNAKVIGTIGVDDSDLLLAVKKWATKNQTNRSALSKMVIEFFQEERNMKVLKVQRTDSGMVAEVEADFKTAYDLASTTTISDKIKLHGTPKREKIQRASNEGFTRSNKGFYTHVMEIIEDYIKRGKNYISFEDMHEELMSIPGHNGKPKFERDGKPIEMSRVRQYLSTSQLKKNPITKGVKRDKEGTGLVF